MSQYGVTYMYFVHLSNSEPELMKKLSNNEAEVKRSIAHIKEACNVDKSYLFSFTATRFDIIIFNVFLFAKQ